MSLGPLKKYNLTATCSQGDFDDSKEVESESVNLLVEKRKYIQELANKHNGEGHTVTIDDEELD